MKMERTNKKQSLRRLVAGLIVALMLLGVAPVFAETESPLSVLPAVGPVQGTVAVKLTADGFGQTGAIMDYLDITLGIDSEKKVLALNVSLLGSGIDFIFAWGADGLRFMIPAVGNDVYGVGLGLLKEFSGSFGGKTGAQTDVKMPDLTTFGTQLTELVSGYMTPETLTVGEDVYTYVLLPGMEKGQTVTWALSKEQWKDLLTKLIQLISGNDELVRFIAQTSGKTAGQVLEELNSAVDDLDKSADSLNGFKVVVFTSEGSLRAVYLGTENKGILYEVQGSLSEGGRTGAIGLKQNEAVTEALVNRITTTADGVFGKMDVAEKNVSLAYSAEKLKNGATQLKLDIIAAGKTLGFTFLYTPGPVNITVPGKPTKMINSTDDLSNVLQGLVTVIYSMLGA